LGRHFPTKVPHFDPQGLDFIGLASPQHHHRLPPLLTLGSGRLPQQCGFAGAGYGEVNEVYERIWCGLAALGRFISAPNNRPDRNRLMSGA
jgi:hypothetical protein